MIRLEHQQEHSHYAKEVSTLGRHDERTEIEAGISSFPLRCDPIPPPALIDDDNDTDWVDDMSFLAISPLSSFTPPTMSSIRRYRDSQSHPSVADAESTAGLESAVGLDFSDVLSGLLSPRPSNNCLRSTAVDSLSPKSAAPSLTASFASISSSCDNLLISLEDTASTPFFSVDQHTSDATNELESQMDGDFVLDDIPATSIWKRGTSDEYIRPRESASSCSVGTQLDSVSKDTSPNKRSDVNSNLLEADVHPAKSQSRLESLVAIKQEMLPVTSEEVIRDAVSLGLPPVRQEPSPSHARRQLTSLCVVDIQPQKSSVPHDLTRAHSPASKRAKKRPKKSFRRWTKEEDNLLMEAVVLYEVPNWTNIAKHVGSRTCKMCAQRWRHALRPEVRHVKKGTWSKDEDERLLKIVSNTKIINERAWDKISKEMGYTRNGIQCRERWKNFLDPTLRLGEWTPEEDGMLMSLHNQHGPKWKQFTLKLVGRSTQRIRRRFDLLTQSKQSKKTKKSISISTQ